MKILVVTPASQGSRKGNRITAARWARLIRSGGHHVTITEAFRGHSADVLIALHAWRSAASIKQFHQAYPSHPIILALTGTDIYGGQQRRDVSRHTMAAATKLVVLQDDAFRQLSARDQRRTTIIYQSAAPSKHKRVPLRRHFEFCVSGHLRPVKDPFRAALAARLLPPDSRIRITHLGAALSKSMETRARREMERNPRYRWLGNQPNWRARQLLARSQALVISSSSEGGPNVICEAVVDDVPVLATKTSGCLGMLGDDYPGYFAVGNTEELAQLMLRCEQDTRYLQALRVAARKRKPLFDVERERLGWLRLLDEVSLDG